MNDTTGGGSEHENDGLGLARQIASSYRGLRPQRRKKRPRGPYIDDRRTESADPTPVGEVMKRFVAEQGWEKSLSVHQVFTRWPQLVGPEVAQHTEPVSFFDGQVTVQADSTAWATQMRLLAPNVVAKLNQALGDGTVARIEVKGPHTPSWKRGPRTSRGRGPRDTYG